MLSVINFKPFRIADPINIFFASGILGDLLEFKAMCGVPSF